ncbi:MAG: hypothetical protein DRG58_08950 [Deltaproteobacteria bacterium]|nr:MAG: hypothetical protein DRG58_08950 [Deltaproteobacteria bacterium]
MFLLPESGELLCFAIGSVFSSQRWWSRFLKPKEADRPVEQDNALTVEQLKKVIAKLRQVNSKQQQSIVYLKEINHRLIQRSQIITDFIFKGGGHQQEQQQKQIVGTLTSLRQDLDPIINSLEKGELETISSHHLTNLKGRAQHIEGQILNMRSEMTRQRQELLNQLQEQKLCLSVQQSDLESITCENQVLKDALKKQRSKNADLEEELQKNKYLGKAFRECENKLKIMSKKYLSLQLRLQMLNPTQALAEENKLLKKTLLTMQEKLRRSDLQRLSLNTEYEKLLGEYERLFAQIE